MAFVHLHVHTGYSLLDGLCRIEEIVAAAKAAGQKAIAITDHGVMYGVPSFYRACQKEGIHPVIGCEVYVAPRSRFDKSGAQDSRGYHLVLLAENNTGYRNLMKLLSLANLEGFYGKPRVDKELLYRYHEGLIALSACIAGEIPRAIREGRDEEEVLSEYLSIFGKEKFYLEIQNHHLPEEQEVNRRLRELSKKFGIPLAATNDVHYIKKEDAFVQEVLMCIQTASSLTEKNHMRFDSEEYYLRTEEEMLSLFPESPEAVENTAKIAERCHVTLPFGERHLPRFSLPEGTEADSYLRSLCGRGIAKRYGEVTPPMQERLEQELSVISSMGFTDYFLIVWDFIRYAKSKGIMVGPGRGSAAGSLVSYVLGITDIDPLKYQLFFERFLNPERVSMPDIDIDFCYERRGEVIDYVVEKYGKDRVAQIITFGTMAAKAAVRDVARALGESYATGDMVAKLIPFRIGQTIEGAMKENQQLAELYATNDAVRRIIDVAQRVEGLQRHASTHAAGVVITGEPLSEYVPLQLSDEAVITQYDKDTLEEMGLLKMDFLGLRNLTVIQKTMKSAGLQPKDIDYEAADVYAVIGAGQTDGMFQLESAGMKNFMRSLKPQTLEDIVAGISLFRPGPMDSIPKYLKNKEQPEQVVYPHPLLEPILKVTYGCIVYQEQVMQIVQVLAGYSLAQADLLRRAMSKKKAEVMEKERIRFLEGCRARGVAKKVAETVFDDMADFAKYAFNKSHAAAYAHVAYQTAFLKCRYPVHFMAALLTSERDNTAKVVRYIEDCKRMGIRLLPPDVNESGSEFTACGKDIRFGLGAIKNVGHAMADKISQERQKDGEFTGIYNFCRRMVIHGINKRSLESLIRAGAFDSFEGNRARFAAALDQIMEDIQYGNRYQIAGQLSLLGEDQQEEPELPYISDYSREEKLAMELDTLGIYVSGHPLDSYTHLLRAQGGMPIAAALASKTEEKMTVSGAVMRVQRKRTRQGQEMAFVTLGDTTGEIEVLVFPKLYEILGDNLAQKALLTINGTLSLKEDEQPKLLADRCRLIPTDGSGARVYVRLPSAGDKKLEEVKNVSVFYHGKTPLYLFFEDTRKTVLAPQDYWVKVCDNLQQNMEKIVGKGNFIVKF